MNTSLAIQNLFMLGMSVYHVVDCGHEDVPAHFEEIKPFAIGCVIVGLVIAIPFCALYLYSNKSKTQPTATETETVQVVGSTQNRDV